MALRLLVLVFAFSLIVGVVTQVIVQLSLRVPIDESILVSKHVTRYELEKSRFEEAKKEGRKTAAARPARGMAVGQALLQPAERFLYSVAEMEDEFGKGPSLDNADARRLYITLVNRSRRMFRTWYAARREMAASAAAPKAATGMPSSPLGAGASEFPAMPGGGERPAELDESAAVLCSVARSRVKQYVRGRMASARDVLLLRLRDAYAHGLRSLAAAIAEDAQAFLAGVVGPPMEHTAATTRSGVAVAAATSCLLDQDQSPCPSILFARHVRRRSNADIIAGCFKTNDAFTQYALGDTAAAAKEDS